MPLTKPYQELRLDFRDLKCSVVELMRIAKRLSVAGNEHDAQAVLKIYLAMRMGRIGR
ncbi:hypothetical protein PCAU_1949 [Pseudomonas chlororaphis subsp. aurantiaca]|uniref:hypothetical protein n=1 Tax=Pseudomonas chlororaphis TaxID=587753 RepID=UPI000865D624|nr:hypothetical protein PCAU_1949 [Pseudomonas chlororaphis subsp. aurantiaca]